MIAQLSVLLLHGLSLPLSLLLIGVLSGYFAADRNERQH